MKIQFECDNNQYPFSFIASFPDDFMIMKNTEKKFMLSTAKRGKKTGKDTFEAITISTEDKIKTTLKITFNDSFENQYSYTYGIEFEYNVKIPTEKIDSVSIENGNPVVKWQKNTDLNSYQPKWHAAISEPKIEFKEKK